MPRVPVSGPSPFPSLPDLIMLGSLCLFRKAQFPQPSLLQSECGYGQDANLVSLHWKWREPPYTQKNCRWEGGQRKDPVRKVLREGSSTSSSPPSSSLLPHWVCGDEDHGTEWFTPWRTLSAWASGFTGAGGEGKLSSIMALVIVFCRVGILGREEGRQCLSQSA